MTVCSARADSIPQQWRTPTGRIDVAAFGQTTAADTHTLAVACGNWLAVLNVSAGRTEQVAVRQLDSEICSLAVCSEYVAVAAWHTPTVQLLSKHAYQPLPPHCSTHAGARCSLASATLEHPNLLYLLAGSGDGVLVTSVVGAAGGGSFESVRCVRVGDAPVDLRTLRLGPDSYGSDIVL